MILKNDSYNFLYMCKMNVGNAISKTIKWIKFQYSAYSNSPNIKKCKRVQVHKKH